MKKAGLETGLLFFEAAKCSMLLQYGQNLTTEVVVQRIKCTMPLNTSVLPSLYSTLIS